MLGKFRDRFEFTKGLGFRLGSLLSLAILPIGLISLVQTLHLSREYARSAEIALLGRTSTAAAGERALLQGALGTADALGPAVLEMIDRPDACSDIMRGFVQRSISYSYAGFTRMDGTTECASHPTAQINAGSELFTRFMADPITTVTTTKSSMQDGRTYVLVVQPLYLQSELQGYITVAVLQDLLRSTHVLNAGAAEARILTFNAGGEVLSSDRDVEQNFTDILPQGKTLPSLLSRSETTFNGVANNGEARVYSVVPVVPGLVYALGSWSRAEVGIAGIDVARRTAPLLPLILWGASLVVAYFAVHRLVLRHIGELRGQMRRFAVGDRSTPPPVLRDAPAEIVDMSQTFHNMARILIRDEEAMEEAVKEKTILLKEVHHRVKNNLQLIASIINMQIRVIEHADAKRVLRSVQDRVSSLATIYRNLYQAEQLDAVAADQLVRDIINQMGNAGIGPGSGLKIQTQLEPLVLMPDQAVPLSLLATEAFTNALKYSGTGEDGAQPWVRVSLRHDGPGWVLLEVENSVGERSDMESTGLGSQLIEAFSTQLEGEARQEQSEGRYLLSLRFKAQGVPEPIEPEELGQNVVLTSAARPGAQH